ncbi:hypothetical protein PGT21_005827 [Puccinia graminis f. sp. tritici]|uniref:Uncharacterized protein n=1 Tax=Puccinia graminis f. sp. tritici TaxID=56615 RepID=A0A5B0LLL5_PUCGR|nr:hypothetical protein PGT21_005827 [Puccinia graminis f. sp. tritici]
MTIGYSFLIAGELMSGANQRANSPNQPLAVFCRFFDSLSAYADMKARPKRLNERFSPGEIMPQFQFPRRSRRFDLRNHTTIEVLQNFTGRSEELRSYVTDVKSPPRWLFFNHTAKTSTRGPSEGAEIAYPEAVWGFFRLGMKSDLINLEKAHGDHLRRSSPGLLRALYIVPYNSGDFFDSNPTYFALFQYLTQAKYVFEKCLD